MTSSDKTSKESSAGPKRTSSNKSLRVQVLEFKSVLGYGPTARVLEAKKLRVHKKRLESLLFSKPDELVSDMGLRFWQFVQKIKEMSESERIENIRKGFNFTLIFELKEALGIDSSAVMRLLNIKTLDLSQLVMGISLLDDVASERLDRIAQIAGMAEDVLESRNEAVKWLTWAHPLLNHETPLDLCHTELGAGQVRRALSAIEWGNVA